MAKTTGDKDTDEILAELESEGYEIPESVGDGSSTEADEGEDSAEHKTEETTTSTETSEEEEEEDESNDTEASTDEDDEEEDDDEDSEEEESDDDDEPEGDDKKGADGKKSKIPLVKKYRANKKLLRKTQEALAIALASKSDEDFDKELQKFSEESGMPIETAKRFLELAAKRSGLPKETMDGIQASIKQAKDREYWDDQHKNLEKDFNSNVVPVLENMGLSKEEIQETLTTLDSDATSPFWAWGKKNKDVSLVKLALQLKKGVIKPINRQSSEGGSRRTKAPSNKEPSEMTPDDVNSMSDEEFDEWSDKMGKGSRSVIHHA